MWESQTRSLSPDFGHPQEARAAAQSKTPIRTPLKPVLSSTCSKRSGVKSSSGLKYRSASQILKKEQSTFEMRQNTLGRDSLDTSYCNQNGLVVEMEAKIDKKNEVIKSQRYEIDHLTRKLKRITATTSHVRRNSALLPSEKEANRKKKNMELEEANQEIEKLRKEVTQLKTKLKVRMFLIQENTEERYGLRDLIAEQETAFAEKLKKLTEQVNEHNKVLLDQNARLQSLQEEKDYEIDRVIMEIDKLKSRLAEKELKLTLNESVVSRASVLTPKNQKKKKDFKIVGTQTHKNELKEIEIQTEIKEIEEVGVNTENVDLLNLTQRAFGELSLISENALFQSKDGGDKRELRQLESMRNLCSDIGILEAEKRYAMKEKRLQGQLGMMKRRYAEVKKELSRAQEVNQKQEQMLKEMSKMAREGTQALLQTHVAVAKTNPEYQMLSKELDEKRREIVDLKKQIHIQLGREEELKDQLCTLIEVYQFKNQNKAAEKIHQHSLLHNIVPHTFGNTQIFSSKPIPRSPNSSGLSFGGGWLRTESEKNSERKVPIAHSPPHYPMQSPNSSVVRDGNYSGIMTELSPIRTFEYADKENYEARVWRAYQGQT